MAPPMVLLKREVVFSFSHDEAGSGGESIRYPWRPKRQEPRWCFQDTADDEVTEHLRTFKAHAVVADPPKLSFLNILPPPGSVPLQSPCDTLDSGRLSSADKNLVALYAGRYRPGSVLTPLGAYLIYDARNNSLSAIPRVPDDDGRHAAAGHPSAFVMCNGDDGSYLLAELVWLGPRFSQAALWLWKSSAPESGWALQPARLTLPRCFRGDLCFSYRGSTLCWVDLLRGMVFYDLGNHNQEPELRFIQLPPDCPSYNIGGPSSEDDAKIYRNLSVEEFCSMACVGDTIKLVCIDGNVFQVPGESFDLTVYSLSHDLSEWAVDRKYNVGNIWASEAYRSTGLPNLAPLFPVLSINEDGVIYLVFSPLRLAERTSQYLVRVDMKNNKVQLYPQYRAENLFPTLGQ